MKYQYDTSQTVQEIVCIDNSNGGARCIGIL